jgi:BirA family transcriptional regulator, biotin operon repressor / biotin---[acetyl-CoA-carboxylase] ligase
MILGTIFRARVHQEICRSTNNVLKSIITEGDNADSARGWYVTTGFQTQGRGQGANTWYSSRNQNLLLSFHAIPGGIAPVRQFMISRMVSIALHEVLSKYIPPSHKVCIKWPNDLYAGRRKIAGILVENQIMGEKISSSIIGIGLNVNETGFPPTIPNPVSLFQLLNHTTDIETILTDIKKTLIRINKTDKTSFPGFHAEYDNHLLGRDQSMLFKDQDGAFEGTITGTDDFGRLCVKTGSVTKHYAFKEIEYIF